ncbi:hypothetical protein J1N35_002410 [Gossypium stocksii]|uniref:phosphogluconate dehydrogenase (NADP(+)-dependent, decarboxylating) n=1 Tax=Gossypium stocksii TaxID=47602 RepID=A0A9D3WKW7_9ROSI|nr:hypothetical protein J1N35_002410 [Gossypium stocksii]
MVSEIEQREKYGSTCIGLAGLADMGQNLALNVAEKGFPISVSNRTTYKVNEPGNFVKMVHNGIKYGDMQLIAEAYDLLKSVGKLLNEELQSVFSEWNKGELLDNRGDGYLVDKVLDKTGMKGTG